MSEKTLARIPLSSIRENPAALRAVNRQDPKYLEFADSVRTRGVLNPILVRVLPSENGETMYGIIEGLHRYTASLDANFTDIPAQIMSASDAEVEELQIIGNLQKIETKNYQYSEHLHRILSRNPTMTVTALAAKLSQSTQWLNDRLGLIKLSKEIGHLVDEGKINLTNAAALSKLPVEEQVAFVDRAMSMSPAEFVPTAYNRKKEIDKARRAGLDAKPAEFVPVAHLQLIKTLKEEMEKPEVGPILCKENNLTTAEQGFMMGVRWALHLDPRSVAAAKAKDDERRKKLADQRTRAAAERAQKKAEAAAAEAAALPV